MQQFKVQVHCVANLELKIEGNIARSRDYSMSVHEQLVDVDALYMVKIRAKNNQQAIGLTTVVNTTKRSWRNSLSKVVDDITVPEALLRCTAINRIFL